MKAIILAFLLVGCSNQSIVLNGFSKHLTKDSDRTNLGIGIRANGYEFGFYDNSRVYRSNAYYLQKRVIDRGRYFADIGAAYYDSGDGRYDNKINPIISTGIKFRHLEIGYALPDIIHLRIPL